MQRWQWPADGRAPAPPLPGRRTGQCFRRPSTPTLQLLVLVAVAVAFAAGLRPRVVTRSTLCCTGFTASPPVGLLAAPPGGARHSCQRAAGGLGAKAPLSIRGAQGAGLANRQ